MVLFISFVRLLVVELTGLFKLSVVFPKLVEVVKVLLLLVVLELTKLLFDVTLLEALLVSELAVFEALVVTEVTVLVTNEVIDFVSEDIMDESEEDPDFPFLPVPSPSPSKISSIFFTLTPLFLIEVTVLPLLVLNEEQFPMDEDFLLAMYSPLIIPQSGRNVKLDSITRFSLSGNLKLLIS